MQTFKGEGKDTIADAKNQRNLGKWKATFHNNDQDGNVLNTHAHENGLIVTIKNIVTKKITWIIIIPSLLIFLIYPQLFHTLWDIVIK